MAADSREAPVPEGQSKPLPKGIILGKDGKPCRTCNTLQVFQQQGKSFSGKAGAAAAFAGTAAAAAPAAIPPRSDCPPDVEALGRSTWTLLHSIAATYPASPSAAEQNDLRAFMGSFSRLYPCWVCAEDFQGYMKTEAMQIGSRSDFGTWLCRAHNAVNVRLGKKEFDCSKWEERWRDGWKDGSCD